MKGYFIGMPIPAGTVRAFTMPGPVKEQIQLRTLGQDTILAGWGSAPGDVVFSVDENHSVLVLNGYFSDAPFLGKFATQEEVAKLLRNYFDHGFSLTALGNALKRVSGSFSLSYVNLQNGDACFVTDRNASRPIWIAKKETEFVTSSHAAALAHLLKVREFDVAGVASLLVYQTQLNVCRSPFRGVQSLPEGTIAVFSREVGLKLHRWDKFSHQPDESLSYGAWLDLTASLLRSSAQRILATCMKPMVFLSGGLDSRITAVALRSQGGNPLLVSLSDLGNVELTVAKRVATALGATHEVFIRDREWYLRTIERSVFETGGCFNWTHGHFAQAYRIMQERHGVDCALIGNWNEAFTQLLCSVDPNTHDLWTPQEFADQIDDLMPKKYKPRNREASLSLLTKDARGEAEATMRADIVARYEAICNISDDLKIIASFFFNWQTLSSLAPYFNNLDVRSAGPERTLMFDADLLDLIARLPSRFRHNSNFGARLVSKLSSKAGRIVNSNTLLPINSPKSLQNFAKYLRPKLGWVRRHLFEDSYKTTGSWPMLERLCAEDPTWKTQIERVLLNQDFLPGDVFDHEAVNNCWNAYRSGDLGRFNDISILLELGILHSGTLQ